MLGNVADFARGLAHPVPALFHVLFKALAIGVYMFGSMFSSSFVNIFIVCILLLAFDFWTVKNVTGRLMVGLRWNSVVEEDGSTSWKFEAQEEGLTSTSLDIAVFWVGLFTPGVVWVLFGVRGPAHPSPPSTRRSPNHFSSLPLSTLTLTVTVTVTVTVTLTLTLTLSLILTLTLFRSPALRWDAFSASNSTGCF